MAKKIRKDDMILTGEFENIMGVSAQTIRNNIYYGFCNDIRSVRTPRGRMFHIFDIFKKGKAKKVARLKNKKLIHKVTKMLYKMLYLMVCDAIMLSHALLLCFKIGFCWVLYGLYWVFFTDFLVEKTQHNTQNLVKFFNQIFKAGTKRLLWGYHSHLYAVTLYIVGIMPYTCRIGIIVGSSMPKKRHFVI